MNDNVVPFKPKPVVEKLPECISGNALCLGCQHEWVAVAPIGTYCLQCPNCMMDKGHYVTFLQPVDDRWQCNCGCQLFFLTPQGVCCPMCGVWQNVK